MATITKLPILNETVYTKTESDKILEKVNSLKTRFNTIVLKCAKLTGLSDYTWLIYSIMFRENADGNTTFVKSTGATGIMQITAETASDALIRENQKNRITAEERIFLTEKLGATKLNAILKRKQLGTPILFTTSQLKDPELNLYLACLYIAQLVDKYTENGNLRLEKVITGYLRYYSNPSGTTASEVISWIQKQNWSSASKTENIAYIKAVGGRNGIAHTIA